MKTNPDTKKPLIRIFFSIPRASALVETSYLGYCDDLLISPANDLASQKTSPDLMTSLHT